MARAEWVDRVGMRRYGTGDTYCTALAACSRNEEARQGTAQTERCLPPGFPMVVVYTLSGDGAMPDMAAQSPTTGTWGLGRDGVAARQQQSQADHNLEMVGGRCAGDAVVHAVAITIQQSAVLYVSSITWVDSRRCRHAAARGDCLLSAKGSRVSEFNRVSLVC
ncbi:hypothetical protein K431DRAFT_40586 [Polychaeton citri CBS 116435]|uniref:Uncharacterized protein n=1 Tax=Polychaeton citri CBS 116435 TaxID=1314669 RepID=A0A9P4QDS4_9PEZI|nr:hypothetical protein K431DRAFT_40586 [Polychaeton citri CBS 116435]